MKPLKTILELRFSEPAEQFCVMSNLVAELTNQVPNTQQNINGTIQIKINEKRATLIIEPARIALNIEKRLDKNETESFVNDFLTKITKHLSYKHVGRIGVRTLWGQERKDITELINKSKEVFFNTKNPLVEESIDTAVPLTLQNNGSRVNYNFGPMTQEQYLQMFSNFKDEVNVPNVFAFADIDYYKSPNLVLTTSDICNYLKEAFEYSAAKSDVTFNLL